MNCCSEPWKYGVTRITPTVRIRSLLVPHRAFLQQPQIRPGPYALGRKGLRYDV